MNVRVELTLEGILREFGISVSNSTTEDHQNIVEFIAELDQWLNPKTGVQIRESHKRLVAELMAIVNQKMMCKIFTKGHKVTRADKNSVRSLIREINEAVLNLYPDLGYGRPEIYSLEASVWPVFSKAVKLAGEEKHWSQRLLVAVFPFLRNQERINKKEANDLFEAFKYAVPQWIRKAERLQIKRLKDVKMMSERAADALKERLAAEPQTNEVVIA